MVSLGYVEPLDGVHESDVAFADQVDQRQSLILVLLGDVDDKAQVGAHQVFLGGLVPIAGTGGQVDFLLAGEQRDTVDVAQIQRQNAVVAALRGGALPGDGLTRGCSFSLRHSFLVSSCIHRTVSNFRANGERPSSFDLFTYYIKS